MTLTRRPLLSNDPKIIANYLFLYSNYAELVVRHQICLNLTSTNFMMMIACIFLMTTTIKGRGHDVARALSGFVCFPPPPPIHPSTRYLFLCYSHFMHRDYCVGKHCRVAKKQNIFSQQINKILHQGRSRCLEAKLNFSTISSLQTQILRHVAMYVLQSQLWRTNATMMQYA